MRRFYRQEGQSIPCPASLKVNSPRWTDGSLDAACSSEQSWEHCNSTPLLNGWWLLVWSQGSCLPLQALFGNLTFCCLDEPTNKDLPTSEDKLEEFPIHLIILYCHVVSMTVKNCCLTCVLFVVGFGAHLPVLACAFAALHTAFLLLCTCLPCCCLHFICMPLFCIYAFYASICLPFMHCVCLAPAHALHSMCLPPAKMPPTTICLLCLCACYLYLYICI